MSKTTIRVNILRNFITLILLVTTLLLGIQYYSSNQLATQAVDKNFHQTTKNIVRYIKRSQKNTEETLGILSLNSSLKQKLDKRVTTNLLNDFIHVLSIAPKIKGIYVGYNNDDFYEVINLKNNPSLLKLYNAPKQSIYATIKMIKDDKAIQFLDKTLRVLQAYPLKKVFFVSSRPWYKEAIKKDDVVITGIYEFKSTKTKGITFAKHIEQTDGVIAIDYTLNELNKFLEDENFNENSYIVLYQDSGEKIATSREISQQHWSSLVKLFKKQPKNSTQTFKHNGVDYFSYHSTTNSNDNLNMNIGVLIPKKSLLEPYIEKIIHSLYAAFAFVILTIPLVFYSTSKMTKPIRALMEENEKIIKRDFQNVKQVNTDIVELHELSVSFVSMSKSIQAYQKSQEELLDAIIKLIAQAIDAKSTYTGGHCKRVPEIAEMLVKAAHEDKDVFKDFSFNSQDDYREFHLGAWLHDCGKVTTPEYVVDKAVKLETIYNRIHEIRTRFEVLFRDTQITYLKSVLNGKEKKKALKTLNDTQKQLIDDFEFIASVNIGGEFMTKEMLERVKKISEYEWIRNFDDKLGLSDVELLRYENTPTAPLPTKEKLLSDKPQHIIKRIGFDYEAYKKDGFKENVPKHLYNYGEIYNLCLEKGTLTPEERFKIDEHVIMSIKMLEQIPFPPQLKRIPEYAGTHHETMIGTGYPKQLTKNELSIPSRIMAIADIFEALTASDRPYKKAKTLSESLKIMGFMVKDGHIDGELFNLFLKSGIYLKYAKVHLKQEQIDEVDISKFIT